MRVGFIVITGVIALLAACAGEPLAAAPPAGVDLSGRWKLNLADSDDPQRLAQGVPAGAAPGAAGGGSGGQSGGRRGRGGQSGTSRGAGDSTGMLSSATIPITTVSEGLQWPGADLEIKQIGGVAAFTSDDENRVYQPAASAKARGKNRQGGPPQSCGWSGSSLVIQVAADEDRPPLEEHFSLSEDRQRLVEVVVLKGGRNNGFTMSRVWDRVP